MLFSCYICRYQTSNKSTLKLHIRSRHTGEKPYVCKFDKCNYRTADHNSFRRHKLRHSGGHKYKCPYEQCNYTSIQSSTYKMHLKNKHPDVSNADGLVLKCFDCSFKTVNSQNYEAHILKHTERKKVDIK